MGVIECRKLRWLCLLQRIEERRILKKLFTGHPGDRRKRGRPRLSWLDDVEGDLRILGKRRERQVTQNRKQWKSLHFKGCSAYQEEEKEEAGMFFASLTGFDFLPHQRRINQFDVENSTAIMFPFRTPHAVSKHTTNMRVGRIK